MFEVLSQIPDLHLHPVDFGPEGFGASLKGSGREKLSTLVETGRAIASVARLAITTRHERIRVIATDERYRDAFACVLIARLTGSKSVIHVHVDYGEWMSPLLKWSLKRADALIAISKFVASSLVSSGHSAARIRVVLNGIDVTDWRPGEGRKEARQEFSLPSDAPVLLTVCRLGAGKGPADLIRSLPSVREEYPDVRLLIVGSEAEPGFRSTLVKLTHELGVAGNVIFTGWRNDVPRLMAAADIFAMPSVREPFGLVFLEAMAMELPVVALQSGAAPEVVEHGITGLLSDPGDIDGLVEHLLALIRDPVRRTAMGAEGRRRAEAYFTAPRMARDTEEVYEWLISTRS
jgi:glycosyltransferase involved in cell wall biosynthesis